MNELTAEIFAVGKWNGMEFTTADLNMIANSFNVLGENHQVPLKLGHNNEQPLTDGAPALGWVQDVWVDGSKLFAKFVDIPNVLFSAINAKQYKNVSIELDFGVEWKENYFSYVLSGVAILGADIPAVNTLADLTTYMKRCTFSKKGDVLHFNLQKFGGSDMTPEEMQAKLDAMQAKLDEAETTSKTFKAQAESAAKAQREAKFSAAKSELEGKLDAAVKDGKIQPATRNEFMAKFSDTDEAVNDSLTFLLTLYWPVLLV